MESEVNMENLTLRVEEFLFGSGLTLQNYFIEQTPVSEMICYRNAEGRQFDLLIDDVALAAGILARLKELNVKIVCLG